MAASSQAQEELNLQLRALQERVTQLESEQQKSLETARREGQELFRLLVDSSPVMMWMAGADGLCTFFNRLWLNFRGRTMEEELGNGWAEGVHPDDLEQCMSTYLSAVQARREFQVQYRLQRADGEYRWILDSGVPIFGPDGEFAGFMGSGIDVHESKMAAAAGPVPLTEREKQVLVLIADGKSTKEVAVELGISYKTADSHRSKIMEKLDIHETATLVRYAVRHGLVKP
ncbi:MAG: helix-turn-helix transcriptional regulator [Bryobacteraceae bacterium]